MPRGKRTSRGGRGRDDSAQPQTPAVCPCGTEKPYADCCGTLHDGRITASTAEQLMRSRYSAFVMNDTAYLLLSWHPSTRPVRLDLDPRLRWTGLEIVGTTGGTAFNTDGTVEFIAHYTESGHADSMRENSSFVRENGNWLYVSAL